MAKNEGYIKLFRSLLEWGYIGNPKMVQLWIVLLLLASHNTREWQDIELQPGQIVTSVRKLCLITMQSEKSTRNCLEKLKKGKQIDIQATNRYTLITICNWADYQGNSDTLKGKRRANEGQTKDKQRATNKNDKNVKNDNNVENYIRTCARGKFSNVFLTDEELAKLKDECPISWEKKIDNLSEYLANNPQKHYASHFDTILKWHKQDTKDTSFNIEKAQLKGLDRTRDIGSKKNPKRKRS